MDILVARRHILVALVDYQTIQEISSQDIQVDSLAIRVDSTATLVDSQAILAFSLDTRAVSLDIRILSQDIRTVNRAILMLNPNGEILVFNQINLVFLQVDRFRQYTLNFLTEQAVAHILVAIILLALQPLPDQVRKQSFIVLVNIYNKSFINRPRQGKWSRSECLQSESECTTTQCTARIQRKYHITVSFYSIA